ncbi:MAG: hypothetical protein ACI808_000488 [Paraglaciecola sp.]|jgi:hypothetical protein
MRGVFTRGNAAIVTTGAGPGHGTVINLGNRHPGIAVVTIFTGDGAGNVRRMFTRGNAAIMTTGTAAGHGTVIKIDTAPATRNMTVIAGITAGDMRGMFAGGDTAIVAT